MNFGSALVVKRIDKIGATSFFEQASLDLLDLSEEKTAGERALLVSIISQSQVATVKESLWSRFLKFLSSLRFW